MNELILCYSLTGSSLRFARKLQAAGGADLFEVKEAKPRTMLSAWVSGTRQALSFTKVPLDGSLPDLSSYDDITLVFPVWAGNPAPAFHSVLPLLPKEADVMLYLVSAGGATKAKVKEDLMTLFKGAGVRTAEIVDISTDAANQQPAE